MPTTGSLAELSTRVAFAVGEAVIGVVGLLLKIDQPEDILL
jgi:hypothetical protein